MRHEASQLMQCDTVVVMRSQQVALKSLYAWPSASALHPCEVLFSYPLPALKKIEITGLAVELSGNQREIRIPNTDNSCGQLHLQVTDKRKRIPQLPKLLLHQTNARIHAAGQLFSDPSFG